MSAPTTSGHRAAPRGALPDGPALPAVAQGAWWHRDPLGMTRALQARWGDVFTLRMPTEGAVVVVCDPACVAELACADPVRAHGGEGRQRLLGLVSPRSILGGDEAPHDAARDRVAHVFTARAIERHRDAIAEIAERHVGLWPRNRPFQLLPRMRALVDEIFARLIVGVRSPSRALALAAGVQRMLWTPGNPPLSVPGPGDGLLGRLVDAGFARRAAPMRRLLAGELERGDAPPASILAAMLAAGLDVDAALDETLPLLMAGQEPPAAALTWLLDRLSRDAGLTERDDVYNETLRLRPPVAAIMRRLVAPTRIAGADLPAGTTTMLPIPLLLRDPRVWDDPEAFRPERFAAGAPEAFVPFGGGERRCIGEHLARLEMDIVVPELLRRRRVRALWPAPERMVVRGTVLVPHRGGLVIARPR